MNDASYNNTTPVTRCCAEVDECVRRNPGATLLAAVGAGMAIALLVRAARPAPSPQRRLARMLADLESRARDESEPVVHGARKFFNKSVDAVSEGLHTSEARVERLLRDARKQLRKVFT